MVEENGKSLEKVKLTIHDLPDERLILSDNPVDFKRFDTEIMGKDDSEET